MPIDNDQLTQEITNSRMQFDIVYVESEIKKVLNKINEQQQYINAIDKRLGSWSFRLVQTIGLQKKNKKNMIRIQTC